MFPLVVLSDSKKERDKITDGCFKIGLKVQDLSELRDIRLAQDAESMAIEEQSAKKSVFRVKNNQGIIDGENLVYIGPSSKISECINLKFNMMVHNGFPRNIDHLIKSVLFNGAKQHYFFSDKGFIKRRNLLLQDLIEPACFLRFAKVLKRVANVQAIKLSVRSSPTFGSPATLNSNCGEDLGTMDPEIDNLQVTAGKKSVTPKKTPTKNMNKTLLKINKSTLMGMLSTSSMSVLNSVLSIMKSRNHF